MRTGLLNDTHHGTVFENANWFTKKVPGTAHGCVCRRTVNATIFTV